MARLSHIKIQHLFKAATFIDNNYIPTDFLWNNYWVVVKYREYPFKYLMRIAHQYATNTNEYLDFKSNPYNRSYLTKQIRLKIKNYHEGTNFFNKDELNYIGKFSGSRYLGNEAHKLAGAKIKNTVWYKTGVWAKQLAKRLKWEFRITANWTKRDWVEAIGERAPGMIFRDYTWARIYPERYSNKKIFFTVGLDEDVLRYKMDCQREGKDSLTAIQIEKFDSYLSARKVVWRYIEKNVLDRYSWRKLLNESERFILDNEENYNEVIAYVWENKVNEKHLINQLIVGEPPERLMELPNKVSKFIGRNYDFDKQEQQNKINGKMGEDLVKNYELSILPKRFHKNVKKVKDGSGYDIQSSFKDGSDKYIEVKTTTGSNSTPFYLSQNELEFMRQNAKRYYIYRLYNLNRARTSARFFKIEPNVENKILMESIEYRCYYKKEEEE